MNNLQVFSSEEFGQVRTVIQGEDIWFVAKDVAEILEFKDAYSLTQYLDDDEKLNLPLEGFKRGAIVINESGLYSAILRSRKSEAKAFKKWVTSKVLPSIRKHGAYMTPETIEKTLNDPDFIIGLATKLKEEQMTRKQAEETIEEQKPKVLFADSVSSSETSILVGELAKLLKQNGLDTGPHRLFAWLRDNGFLIKRKGSDYNMPTQKSMEFGLFEIKESVITHPVGHVTINKTQKVTGKGQLYFVEKLLGESA